MPLLSAPAKVQVPTPLTLAHTNVAELPAETVEPNMLKLVVPVFVIYTMRPYVPLADGVGGVSVWLPVSW